MAENAQRWVSRKKIKAQMTSKYIVSVSVKLHYILLTSNKQ